MLSWPLTEATTRVFGGWHVEATPFRSEAGLGHAGPPLPKLRRHMPFIARGGLGTAIRYASAPASLSVHIRSSCVGVSASAKLAHFCSGHRTHEFTSLRCGFYNRYKRFSPSFLLLDALKP
eukprot:6197221-Pleurochrysis_carterae.AAC.5